MAGETNVLTLFEGEGEVRSLLRRLDWSRSPLGHPSTWPPTLITVVRLMLNSKFPMFVAWGPQLGFLYNDEYAPILGNKHPSLGQPFREIWHEIWHDVGPVVDAALAGKSSYFENHPLLMLRTGRLEQTWFTFSYSPVEGEHGEIEGMYCTCIESTREVLARRRQAFQLRLSDTIRMLDSPTEVIAQASGMLGEQLGVTRVGFCEIQDDENTFYMSSDWNRDEHGPSLAGQVLALDDFGPEIGALLRSNAPMVVDDVASDPRTALHARAYHALGARAVLALPLVRSGRLVALMYLHDTAPRAWSDGDVELAREMAERTWAAVERARAQVELRAERDRTQYIIDSLNEGFAQIAQDWTITDVNTEGARMLGLRREELVGQNLWQASPRLLGSERETLYRRVYATRVPESIETPFAQGRFQGWLEIRVYPLLDGGITLFYRDISDRKRSERELQEANRRKDEFLAMLAHELRNPLAPIGAAAELMQMVELSGARLKQTSQVISRQVRHMTGLVDDLLDVSRVTRGLVEIKRTPQDIKRIAAGAVEQVRPLMEARRHHLVVDLAAERAQVLGDENRLVQILANLLNNAAKYTPEGGKVRLYTEVHEHEVVLAVSDNGIGVPASIQSDIFELFTQAERTSDRSQGGLGLGLALVRSLVELHGGQVLCRSEGEGCGSTFEVRLPRLAAAAESEGGNGAARVHLATHGLRILLVDDNADAAAMLAMVLEAAGHQVIVETGSHSALARATAESFAVALLDIGLPELDGYELARRIRSLPGGDAMTLVAVTGYGDEHDRHRAAAAGFDHHFVKPVDSRKLLTLLSPSALA